MRRCGNCGREVPEDSASCPACGAALATEPQAGARRTVTILFADMVGSIGMRVRAMVAVRGGRFEDVERTAREQIAIIDETDFIVDRSDARIGLAEVLEVAGRRDEAQAAATDALGLYEAKGNVLQANLARVRLERLRS